MISKALSRAEEIICIFKSCEQGNHRTVVIYVLYMFSWGDFDTSFSMAVCYLWLWIKWAWKYSLIHFLFSQGLSEKNSCLSHSPGPSSPCALLIVQYPLGSARAVVWWSALWGDTVRCSAVSLVHCSKVKRAAVPVWQTQVVGGQMFFCRRDPLKPRMFLEGRYFCCILQAMHLKSLKSVDYCPNLCFTKHSETYSSPHHEFHFSKGSFEWFEETH